MIRGVYKTGNDVVTINATGYTDTNISYLITQYESRA